MDYIFISGDRWKSASVIELRYDDEIYGLETGSCTENMQSCIKNKESQTL